MSAVVPAVIAAFGSILAAALTAIIGRHVANKVTVVKNNVASVRTLVNGRLDHALKRIEKLEIALEIARAAPQESAEHIQHDPSERGSLFGDRDKTGEES